MFNPRDIERLMKDMKMKQIEADEVLIKTDEKTIVIKNPQVVKSEMMGKTTFQVTGDVFEENSGSDIDIIMQKTGVSRERAEEALKETGDTASAIMLIENKE
ncbi:MAG: Nascent polypeptide-associated complex protein [Candidatus Aenigmarchaeota archaeon]|nr:Nascent polypeptide-associated complex protein [Candidatus Aenigmarchaeota archaeon]